MATARALVKADPRPGATQTVTLSKKTYKQGQIVEGDRAQLQGLADQGLVEMLTPQREAFLAEMAREGEDPELAAAIKEARELLGVGEGGQLPTNWKLAVEGLKSALKAKEHAKAPEKAKEKA